MQDGDVLILRARACGTVRRERSLLLTELFFNVRPPKEGVTFQCEAKSNDQLKLRSNLEQPLLLKGVRQKEKSSFVNGTRARLGLLEHNYRRDLLRRC